MRDSRSPPVSERSRTPWSRPSRRLHGGSLRARPPAPPILQVDDRVPAALARLHKVSDLACGFGVYDAADPGASFGFEEPAAVRNDRDRPALQAGLCA